MKTIFFDSTVSASTAKVLSSQLVTFPFETVSFSATFPQGTDATLLIYFIASLTDQSSLTSRPAGENILGQGSLSQTTDPYLAGSGDASEIVFHKAVFAANTRILLYANNSDTYSHTVRAKVEVLELTTLEGAKM
jgi:hypothetical protein